MKTLAALILIMGASSAMAAVNTRPEWPTIDFQGQYIPVNEVCVSGEGFQTLNPVRTCAEVRTNSVYACHTEYLGNPQGDSSAFPLEKCRSVSAEADLQSGEYARYDYSCARYTEAVLRTGPTTEQSVCTQWTQATDTRDSECLKYEKRTQRIPTEYAVALVYDDHSEQSGYAGVMGFKIPACH